MTFHASPALIERSHLIDFENQKVHINFKNTFWNNIVDSCCAFIEMTGAVFISILFITLLLNIPINYKAVLIAISSFFLINTIIYKTYNNKVTTKLNLLIEEIVYFIPFFGTCTLWKKKTVDISGRNKVIFKSLFLFRYKLSFYGDCKENLSKIEYKPALSRLSWKLIITFKKPTEGRIIAKYKGFITSVNID